MDRIGLSLYLRDRPVRWHHPRTRCNDENKPTHRCNTVYHRLNGSSSPVLTATCLSYGSLCDFLDFFPNRPGGHTPRPILTQNDSNDVGSRKDVPFGVKITTFWNPWPSDLQNHQNLPNFGRYLEILFSLDFAFNIGGLRSKHPLIFIGAQEKCHSE